MTDHFILEAFWQKGHNCAFIAFAKAGIMCYGVKGVMQISNVEREWCLKLRNNRKWKLNADLVEELNKTNRTGFRRMRTDKGRTEINTLKTLVKLFYAVIITHMTKRGYMGKRYTKASAISALNDEGIRTTYFHSLLGWKRTASYYLEEKDLHSLKKKRHILLFTEKHIVAASKGYLDRYGKATRMGGHLPYLLREKSGAWYSLR